LVRCSRPKGQQTVAEVASVRARIALIRVSLGLPPSPSPSPIL
jgi:hypothetical protein